MLIIHSLAECKSDRSCRTACKCVECGSELLLHEHYVYNLCFSPVDKLIAGTRENERDANVKDKIISDN